MKPARLLSLAVASSSAASAILGVPTLGRGLRCRLACSEAAPPIGPEDGEAWVFAAMDSTLRAARDAVNSAEFSAANCELLRARLGLSEGELRRVVVAYPTVLGYSYEDNLAPSLAALQQRLSLSESQLRRVVIAQPQVLGYSYDANVAPSLSKLQRRLQLCDEELARVVVGQPAVPTHPRAGASRASGGATSPRRCRSQVLSYSFEAKIEPALAKLQAASPPASPAAPVARGARACSRRRRPSSSSPRPQARLELSASSLRRLVLLYPAVLGYSYDANLAPKLQYLQEALELSPNELRAKAPAPPPPPAPRGATPPPLAAPRRPPPPASLAPPPPLSRRPRPVLMMPALLGYSLERRYRPRVALCRAHDKPLSAVLSRISRSHREFEAWATDGRGGGGSGGSSRGGGGGGSARGGEGSGGARRGEG